MIIEVFFDVETKSLFRDIGSSDPMGLGISIVSVYRRVLDLTLTETSGEMRSFWEAELPDMWALMRDATRVIGFNTLKFDNPALAPYAPTDFKSLPHFDIMQHVRNALGRNLSLATLAQYTLGKGKTDTGLNAVTYFRKGDPESLAKLKMYCEADVALTRDLYDYGLAHKHLKYIDAWNNVKELPVDFSYPSEVLAKELQMGLF
jgi:DEAD/DEAH box helicase domain-containing protein